ncbi:hypothetical protein GQ457_18G004750 [Hibiscus cannabinus]
MLLVEMDVKDIYTRRFEWSHRKHRIFNLHNMGDRTKGGTYCLINVREVTGDKVRHQRRTNDMNERIENSRKILKLFQIFYILAILLLFISAEVNAGNVDGNSGENSLKKLRRCREVIGKCTDECNDDCCDRECWMEFMGPLEGTGHCVSYFCLCYYNC